MITSMESATSSYSQVERRERPSGNEFFTQFVDRAKPVIISGAMKDWKARKEWCPKYLKAVAPDLNITVKEFGADGIKTKLWTMGKYADFLENLEGQERG